MNPRRSRLPILFALIVLLALARVSRAQEVFDWRAYTRHACIVHGVPSQLIVLTSPGWDTVQFQDIEGKIWLVQVTYSPRTGAMKVIRILINDEGRCLGKSE